MTLPHPWLSASPSSSRLNSNINSSSSSADSVNAQQSPAPAELAPIDVWAPAWPSCMTYCDGWLLLAVQGAQLQYNVLIKHSTSQQQHARADAEEETRVVLDPQYSIVRLACSGGWVYVQASSTLVNPMQLLVLDLARLQHNRTLQMRANRNMYGVNEHDGLLLTGVPTGSSLTLLDARSGELRAELGGSIPDLWLLAAALSPHTSGQVTVADDTSQAIVGLHDNKTAWSTPFPKADRLQLGSLTVDQHGQYAYALYGGYVQTVPTLMFVQYELSNGQQAAALHINLTGDDTWNIGTFVQAGHEPGQLFIVHYPDAAIATLNVSSAEVQPSFELSQHKALPEPTELATSSGELLYAATNGPQGFVVLNATGQMVATVAVADLDCRVTPYQAMTIDRLSGDVLLPLCNGSLSIYDQLGRHRSSAVLGDGTCVPVAAAPGPNNTVYVVCWPHGWTQLTQYHRQTGKQLGVVSSNSTHFLQDVQVDAVDGGLWATASDDDRVPGANGTSYIIRWAANHTLLSTWSIVPANGGFPYCYDAMQLAVDREHGRIALVVNYFKASSIDVLASYLLFFDIETGALLPYQFTYPDGDYPAGVAVTSGQGQLSRLFASSPAINGVLVFEQPPRTSSAHGVVAAQ